MDRIAQEIFCTKSGGGCGGFFVVRLNIEINHRVKMICPKCQHEHLRSIIDGVMHEEGRFDGSDKDIEELCPTIGAWSEEPRTVHMKKHADCSHVKERDGAVIKSKKDLRKKFTSQAQLFLLESWAEKHTPD